MNYEVGTADLEKRKKQTYVTTKTPSHIAVKTLTAVRQYREQFWTPKAYKGCTQTQRLFFTEVLQWNPPQKTSSPSLLEQLRAE